ncbi:cerevisin [Malassezia caprae]|uniref:Cerevisin n=1 Tax=Malassezia caprae TaxID=1381934 RepID=A0AAF0E8R2_9BASI|nr:cerevisin [Malassezia caprae]
MGPRQIVKGAIAALACACATLAMPANVACGAPAPLVHAQSDTPVPEHYMVILKPGVSSSAFLAHRAAVAQFVLAERSSNVTDADFGFRHIYDMDTHLQGYAGRFSPAMLQYIRAQPEVDYVEADSIVRATVLEQDGRYVHDMPPAAAAQTMPWDNPARHLTEDGAPWGLARISHRRSLSLGTFNKYVYESIAGDGVTAYIIDTGIRVDHEDFGGRARWGTTIPLNDKDEDAHGHGTHCAGTIGSSTYGVAKKAELVAVKVLGSNGQGAMSDVTAGVLWAVADAQERTRKMRARPWSPAARKHRGFVANMSLGGTKSPTLERAVNGAVMTGMHFAVAAGNENQDACNVSPAAAKHAVTVGASTITDERAFFSNKGSCVDIFAPGLRVLSTWNEGPRSANVMSGTSMASPHVVGLMAYMLSIYGTEDFGLVAEPPHKAPHGAWRSWVHAMTRMVPVPFQALLRAHEALWPAAEPDVAVLSVESRLTPAQLKRAMRSMATPGSRYHE